MFKGSLTVVWRRLGLRWGDKLLETWQRKGCVLSWDYLTRETFVTTLSKVTTILGVASSFLVFVLSVSFMRVSAVFTAVTFDL